MKFKYISTPENLAQVPFRFSSSLLAPICGKLGVSPNQVTIARALIVAVAMYFFAIGEPIALLWGVLLFYVFEILDHVDGDLARYSGKFSAAGPLLEQFVDTWGSRPSNLFGFSIAYGMYSYTGSTIGLVLFGLTALGRMLWLEYRDVFGWVRTGKSEDKSYMTVFGSGSLKQALRNLFDILYTWNNTFLLLGALLYIPAKGYLGIDFLVVGFTIVAILNNLPWIAIVAQGLSSRQITETR